MHHAGVPRHGACRPETAWVACGHARSSQALELHHFSLSHPVYLFRRVFRSSFLGTFPLNGKLASYYIMVTD